MRKIIFIVFLLTSWSTMLSQKLELNSNFRFKVNPELTEIYKSISENNNNKIKQNIIWKEFENATYVNPWIGFDVDSQKFTADYFWEKDQLIITGHFGNPDQYSPRISIILNKNRINLSYIINSEDSIFSLNSKSDLLNEIAVPIKKASFSLSKSPSQDNTDNLIANIEFETYDYYKFSKNKNPTYRKLKSRIKGIFPIYYLERCE